MEIIRADEEGLSLIVDMKIDRLIGIITTLQRKGKVTAPYLAEKFEVSRRTINRDIETICNAGIPIVTTQGQDGGIEIMQGFTLDTTVFTEEELQSIFVGLKSLDSVSKTEKHKKLSEKYGRTISVADSIVINLSSYHKESLAEKIELLKEAIKEHKCVSFHYYYNKGEEDKLIEPALIVFEWSSWYIFGWCPARMDFRLYKLTRLWDLQLTETEFKPREIPEDKMNFLENITDSIFVTAIYEASEKYRLVEEYGPYSFKEIDDGRLYTEWGFSSVESALRWHLSFGSRVEIIQPESFKEIYAKELKEMFKRL